MTSFGIELELSILVLLSNLGQTLFAKFEIETQRWRQVFKWMILHGGTIGLYFLVGHWALVFPLLALGAGCIVHATWCRKHEINPWNATPRERYWLGRLGGDLG